MYHVHLVPCTTSPGQSYSIPIVCDPRDLVIFELPLRFQQISDPVPTKFSLNLIEFLVADEDCNSLTIYGQGNGKKALKDEKRGVRFLVFVLSVIFLSGVTLSFLDLFWVLSYQHDTSYM